MIDGLRLATVADFPIVRDLEIGISNRIPNTLPTNATDLS
jgi:hypothetical protein